MKYKQHDVWDGVCTSEQYVSQFKNTSSDFAVGSLHVQHPKTWQETLYKVLFVNDTIVLAQEIEGTSIRVGGTGRFSLFHSSGVYKGWEYSFGRSDYRLQKPNTEAQVLKSPMKQVFEERLKA